MTIGGEALEVTESMPGIDLDDLEDEAESSEPLDVRGAERKLVTQPYDFSVDQLVTDVKKARILLIEVPYQREYVWDDAKASRFIESLLLNVPVPVCYFAENDDGTWEVIDGLQRTQSIVRFLRGDLLLRGLSVLSELNGSRFFELPLRDQRRIETRTLRFVVITAESHPDIKFDVFERLNTGAVKLMPQELRNCIYRGFFNDQLSLLVKDPNFRVAIGRSRDARMRDQELTLRFFALYEGLAGYKPPISQYLNEYMRSHRNAERPIEIVDVFRETMGAIAGVFGGDAFRGLSDGKLSPNLNRAMFDAVSISFAFANREQAAINARAIRDVHVALLTNVDYLPLIGRATADRTRMHGRIRRYSQELQSVGVDVSLPQLPIE